MDIFGAGFALGVDPAGQDTGLFAAEDIGTKAIAHDHGLFFIKTGDPGKTAIEIFHIRLVDANLLGDKNAFKETGNIRAFDAAESVLAT